MRALSTIRVCLLSAALGISACRCYCQDAQGETLSGPDSHETGQGPHGHLFGDWGGERSRLLERGVRFDFQCVSDSLWNLESVQPERFASRNRFRCTVDIDFGALTGHHGLYFHANCALASWRQSWCLPRNIDKPERHVQRKHLPTRFLVVRKALAGRAANGALGSVCRTGFVWRAALRRILHLRANGLRARQSLYNDRVFDPPSTP